MEKFSGEQSKQDNIYEISQERKILRENLADAEAIHLSEKILNKIENNLEKADKKAKEFHIKDVGGLSEAKELYKKQKIETDASAWIDEKAIIQEIGADYVSLNEYFDELNNLSDFRFKKLREAKTDPFSQKAYEDISQEINTETNSLEENISKIEDENYPVFRAHELASYKKGLHQEGHISPVPSVKKSLNEIGIKMISGKPMFLFGPTGTGKTSLARFSAKHFTGQDAEMVFCNPQTRETSIWGKTGLRPAEGEAGKHGAIQTVDIYGPLAKAMKQGKVCVFDEFTALPKEQQVFIKGIFNAKIGDTINVVGNGQTKIETGFQMIFTANLKSEKDPECQELPPKIAREFEQNNLKINYTPKDEAYDIMLSRLMNKDGSLDISYYDLNTTLPKLAEAMAEIQLAYTKKESDKTAWLTGTKDASGKVSGLKKFVMTQGTIEVILDDWQTEKSLKQKNISFAEFLDQSLKRGLTFEEYPEKDRILAAKILASKGFLVTLSAKDLNLPKNIFDVSAIKKLRGEDAVKEIRGKSSDIKRIPLSELVKIDPFNRRKEKAAVVAAQFLPETEKAANAEGITSFNKAREIIGKENFYGPEEIEKAFGFRPENVFEIPFSEEELKNAKKLGLKLIYYPEYNGQGEKLTIEAIVKFSLTNTAQNGEKLLYKDQFDDKMKLKSSAWFANDRKVLNEKIASGWQLVSEEIIDNTTDKNYRNQTEVLIKKYEESFPNNLPQDWNELLSDFRGFQNPTADQFGKHKLSQILREPCLNTVFRYLLIEKLTGKKILKDKYSWSSSVSSDGNLLNFGGAGADGAGVRGGSPGSAWSDMGAVFSRSEFLKIEH